MAANPGTVRAESIRFLESDGNAVGGLAGTWSGSIAIPAGACIVDVIVHCTAVWNATTTAVLTVGDGDTADGYYTAVNLKATDLTAGQDLTLAMAGGKQGTFLGDASSAGVHTTKAFNLAARNCVAKVITTGAPVTGRTGDTTVTFLYTYASPVKPGFVSA
jgi:hypothetical protein